MEERQYDKHGIRTRFRLNSGVLTITQKLGSNPSEVLVLAGEELEFLRGFLGE